MRPGGGFGVLCSFVHRTVEGQLVVLIVVDVADVPEDEEEEQSDAIGCTGLRAGRTWRELRGPRQGMDAARATMVEVNRSTWIYRKLDASNNYSAKGHWGNIARNL